MNTQLPLVSIVTNSFNYGRFIEDTLLSVKNQDYPNIEHIVVDGGSTDNTCDILRKYENQYNLKWVSEPDRGQTHAINKGFRRSKGEIIGWLDADDVYFDKHCISFVAETFCNHPDLDAIFGNDVLMNENNVIFRARHFPQWSYKRILRRFYISQPTTFFRSRVTQNYAMDENLKFGMDLEYFLRIGKTCKIEHRNRILAATRVHSGRKSISKKMLAVQEDNEVLRKFGHKFDLSYYLYTFFVDFPATTAERMLGISEILNMKENLKHLAFDATARDRRHSFVSQFAPESMLGRLLQ